METQIQRMEMSENLMTFPRFAKFPLPKNLKRICVNTVRELLILFIEKFKIFTKILKNNNLNILY